MLLVVAQLGQSTSNLTLVGWRVLWTRNCLIQRWRTTDEDLRVGRWRWQVVLQEILGDVTGLTLPSLRSLVDEVVNVNLVLVLSGNLVNLLLQQNILSSQRTVEQVNLGVVLRVLGDLVKQLVQWSNTRTSTNQRDVLELVRLPLPLDNRTLKGNSVIWLQVVNMLGELTLWVSLDDELNGSLLVNVRDWSVRTNDIVSLWSDVLGQNTRSSNQARDIIWAVQLKHIMLGVAGDVP